MTIAENLRRLRETRGLKQDVLAQVVDVKQQTYSKYETGELRIPAEMIDLIAKFYGISVSEIYGEEMDPAKKLVLDAAHKELYAQLVAAQNTIIELQQQLMRKNK